MKRNAATTTNAMIANIAAKIPPITLPLPVECDEMPSSRVKRRGSERTLAPSQYFYDNHIFERGKRNIWGGNTISLVLC